MLQATHGRQSSQSMCMVKAELTGASSSSRKCRRLEKRRRLKRRKTAIGRTQGANVQAHHWHKHMHTSTRQHTPEDMARIMRPL